MTEPDMQAALDRATALVERYGKAIVQISKALNDPDLSDRARVIRAQVVVARLAEPDA